MPHSAAMHDRTPSKRPYLMIAAFIVLALALIAAGMAGIPPLILPLIIVSLVLWAPVAAATALIPFPLMIALVVTALAVAGAFMRHWRAVTWLFLAVNALFVLWMAWVITEYPRPCFEHVGVPVPGSDMVRLVPTDRPTPCPASSWNTEGAHVQRVMLLWIPVLAVLGFMWFRTRPEVGSTTPLPTPR